MAGRRAERFWLFLFFSFVLPLPLKAATVSFLVLEAGRDAVAADSHSLLWEGSLLDVFFEEGHIVSNAPIQSLSSPVGSFSMTNPAQFPREVLREYNAARSGGSDFFILALLDYQGTIEGERPKSVALRLFKIAANEFLGETRYTGGASGSRPDETAAMKNTIKNLLSRLKN
ncbi:hypothetical protein AGMMS49928_17020 [Spirochaetia bacterium]|nr:hypothetical protein AGMMS49928_17020 [Spirochaetia bacterium]